MARETGPIRVVGPNPFADKPMFSLALIREAHGLTTKELAAKTGLDEDEVEAVEGRMGRELISMLRSYAVGLGGEAQVVVVVGEHRYVLKG